MLVTIGYTGTRWGETIGLERDFVLPTLINVEWQLREIRGRFFRLPPKDDSYRSTNWEPLVPVDLPIFLAGLLTRQAAKHTQQRCACAREHGGTGRYMFYPVRPGHTASGERGRHGTLLILRTRGQAAPGREDRHPQDEGRALSGERTAARRRCSPGLLATRQGQADAPRATAQS